jgi:DMSO/TMAO reductase YedYZ molybdopterin-dependent catalytic subunit
MDNNFANWKFKIHGLVENPLELSLTDLHAMKKQMQITEHSCIQGWTAIGQETKGQIQQETHRTRR